jgi:hypothetical protein
VTVVETRLHAGMARCLDHHRHGVRHAASSAGAE